MNKIINKFENPIEVVCIVLILLISLYFFFGAFAFSDGDQTFPLLTSGATIIFTLAYVIKTLLSEDGSEQKKSYKDYITKNVVISVLLFVGYLVFIKLFGFLIATVVFVTAYPLCTGCKKKLSTVILVLVNVGIVLLFQALVGVTLSRGSLIDLTNLFF